jgi:hypothetical protein
MRLFGLLFVAAAVSFLCAGAVQAGKLDDLYDDRELADLQASYQRGWKNNFDNVLSKAFSAEERSRFANVQFRMERRIADREPVGFLAGGNQVLASAASLKFFEDVMLAYTWLDLTGRNTQSVTDYLMMLRYWDARRGRPPKPLDTMCIPATSTMDAKITEQATRVFDVAMVFVLLHEYGHILHRHPGNAGVPPAISRTNEAQADGFALDVFTRLREPPIGVALLFFIFSHLHESRIDFRSDEAYQATLAARTHPVSPERLQAFARNVSAQAETYGRFFLRGAQVSAMSLSVQVTQLAYMLGDPDIQRLAARIGQTVRPVDLAPRPKGRHLSAPCNSRTPSGQSFDGTLRGKFYAGRTDFDADVVLERNGENVAGTFSYGAGYGRMDGRASPNRLLYRWILGADKGAGVMTLQGGEYRGTWGTGDSETGGGRFELTKENR